MTLTEKIELLIKRTQMSASQFADVINIPRSSISHIISGRNKPSLDVVQKILKSFPEISAEELLYEDRNLLFTPQGNDVKKGTSQPSSSKPSPQISIGGLFDQPNDTPRESDEKKSPDSSSVQSILKPIENSVPVRSQAIENPSTIEVSSGVNQIYSNHTEKFIERVIIFYSDGTFSESKPSK